MNSCYSKVLDKAKTVWKFQRLALTMEFAKKQSWIVPFNIFEYFLNKIFQANDLEVSTLDNAKFAFQNFKSNTHISDFEVMYQDDQQMAVLFPGMYAVNDDDCQKEQAYHVRCCMDLVSSVFNMWLQTQENVLK